MPIKGLRRRGQGHVTHWKVKAQGRRNVEKNATGNCPAIKKDQNIPCHSAYRRAMFWWKCCCYRHRNVCWCRICNYVVCDVVHVDLRYLLVVLSQFRLVWCQQHFHSSLSISCLYPTRRRRFTYFICRCGIVVRSRELIFSHILSADVALLGHVNWCCLCLDVILHDAKLLWKLLISCWWSI